MSLSVTKDAMMQVISRENIPHNCNNDKFDKFNLISPIVKDDKYKRSGNIELFDVLIIYSSTSNLHKNHTC